MHGLTRVGERPVLGPVVAGLAGLVGGVFTGWLGGRAALEIFGPFDFENPWDLFGNAIGMLLPMMVMSVGIVTGFLAGTVMLPSLLMLGLGWESAGKTFLFLLLLLLPVVPLTLWLMVEVSSSLSTRDSVWV